MTKGEYRLASFPASGKEGRINDVKNISSGLIDEIQDIVDLGGEAGRCAAIAQTKYEEASMWAVKAITKPEQ